MRKEIADKWIAALRSGKYKQTKGYLCVDKEFTQAPITYKPGHCCLGVLCEIAIEEGLEIEKNSSIKLLGGSNSPSSSYNDEKSFLPYEVQVWADMHSNDGDGTHIEQEDDEGRIYDTRKSLAELNDDGKTFEEIAAAIAENWEKL
jgi:hypothetical protein